MKLKLLQIRKNLRPNQVGIVKEFLHFLQEEAPLRNDVTIVFADERDSEITTGYHNQNLIKVFTRSRILADVMRTLAHEWIHQVQFEDLENNKKTETEVEAQANAVSGHLLKKFIKENPYHEVEFYKD